MINIIEFCNKEILYANFLFYAIRVVELIHISFKSNQLISI